MSTEISNEKKQEVIDAAKNAAIDTFKATATKSLTWWERAIWIVLAAIAAGASALLTGCGHTFAYDGENAVICKDDTCIVISIQQNHPEPVEVIEIVEGK